MAEKHLADLVVELQARGDKFEAALTRMESQLGKTKTSVDTLTKGIGDRFDSVAGRMQSAFATLTAVAGLGGLVALSKSAVSAADDLGDMAEALGLSTDQLQELQYAAEQMGSSSETMTTGIAKFQRTLADAVGGSREASDLFQQLGLNAKDLASLPLPEAMAKFADAIKNTSNQTQQLDFTTAAFGKGAVSLTAVLKQGGDALTDMRHEAHETGNVMQSELVASAGNLENEFKKASGAITTEFQSALIQLAPHIVAVTKAVAGGVTSLADFVTWMGRVNQSATIGDNLTQLKTMGDTIAHLQEKIAAINAGSGINGFLNSLDPSRKDKQLADLTAQLEQQTAVYDKLSGANHELLMAYGGVGQAAASAGAQIEGGFVAPIDHSTSAAEKAADALSKARDAMREEIATLTQQNAILQQVQAGTLSYADGMQQMQAATSNAKVQDDALAEAKAKLKARQDALNESIQEGIRRHNESVSRSEAARQAFSDELTALSDQTQAYKIQAAEIQKGIDLGLTWEQVQRNIAAATIAANEALNGDEYTRLARQALAAKNNVDDLTESFHNSSQGVIHFGDIMKEVASGLAQGTLDIGHIFKAAGSAALTEFATSFLLGKKDKFDLPIQANVLGLVGPNGIIGDLLGQGGNLGASLFGENFLTSLKSFAGSAGTIATLAFLGSQIGGGLAHVLGVGKTKEGSIGAQVAGGLFGGIFGPLGGVIGDLFHHTPTKGSQIRAGTADWLDEIGVSFADQIKSSNYFFKPTKALAEAMFGGDFLAASKQILTEHAGPELARQFSAVGAFVTAEQAKKLGKPLEQTATTFGNMIVANLGDDADLQGALNEIVSKANITFEGLVTALNSSFEDSAIGAEFYKDVILGTVDLFTQDLPTGINAAKVALKSFTDDGIFGLSEFQTQLGAIVTQVQGTQQAVASLIGQGLSSGMSASDLGAQFASTVLPNVLREGLVQSLLATQLPTLFQDMDLSAPIAAGSAEAETLRMRVQGVYQSVLDTLTAAGLLPESFGAAAGAAAEISAEAQAFTDAFSHVGANLSGNVSSFFDRLAELQANVAKTKAARRLNSRESYRDYREALQELADFGSLGDALGADLADQLASGFQDGLTKLVIDQALIQAKLEPLKKQVAQMIQDGMADGTLSAAEQADIANFLAAGTKDIKETAKQIEPALAGIDAAARNIAEGSATSADNFRDIQVASGQIATDSAQISTVLGDALVKVGDMDISVVVNQADAIRAALEAGAAALANAHLPTSTISAQQGDLAFAVSAITGGGGASSVGGSGNVGGAGGRAAHWAARKQRLDDLLGSVAEFVRDDQEDPLAAIRADYQSLVDQVVKNRSVLEKAGHDVDTVLANLASALSVKLAEAADQGGESISTLVEELRAGAHELRFGLLTNEAQMGDVQQRFDAALLLARGGNIDAARNALDLGRQLVDVTRTAYASSSTTASTVDVVARALDSLADQFGSSLTTDTGAQAVSELQDINATLTDMAANARQPVTIQIVDEAGAVQMERTFNELLYRSEQGKIMIDTRGVRGNR